MDNRIVIICRPEDVAGFKMAGVKTYTYLSMIMVRNKINDLVEREKIGLIGVDDKFYSQLDEEFISELEELDKPVVVPIPAPEFGITLEEKKRKLRQSIEEMIERSSGIYIKIER